MKNYQRVIELSYKLNAAVEARNAIEMQQRFEDLELAYGEEFGDSLDCYEAVHAFALMNLAGARYFSFNNMFTHTHNRYEEMACRMEGIERVSDYSEDQKNVLRKLFMDLEGVHKATPERHQNMVVGRNDTRCCLCRVLPANKTGSHMVPNFLTHPSLSWDGKGKRYHEALNHDFLNEMEMNCSFYGRDVPEWRFAMGNGITEVTEEDRENNVNQIEYDNEFCSHCEDRFGILESAYSQYYNRSQKKISPRVAYLFWLSVLWRMSMGSMSIFMNMEDELSLRRLLNDNMLDSAQDISNGEADLGDWKYAIFRASGLRDGDKGILGCRKECSPYVVMYNDLVMVFYHSNPTDDELTIGPIKVSRENLNDWHIAEKEIGVDRRWFWNVRDWFVESSYDYYDPIRERMLRTIREDERSEDKVVDAETKSKAIELAEMASGPQEKLLRLRKFERITCAWFRVMMAKENGEEYDPLQDEELFLNERDFDNYYHDLAALSRHEGKRRITLFPFYAEARMAIPDKHEWG